LAVCASAEFINFLTMCRPGNEQPATSASVAGYG